MRPSGPYGHYKAKIRVTISKTGYFVFSIGAFNAMGQPEALLYGFDVEARKIGFIPAAREHQWSYPVDKRKNSQGSFSYRTTAREFLNSYGISWRATRRFLAVLENGVLEIDVRD